MTILTNFSVKVKYIREAIADKFNIKGSEQVLIHANDILEDDYKLSTYKIYSDSALHHYVLDREIEVIDGKSKMVLKINKNLPVRFLRWKIGKLKKVSPFHIFIYYKNKVL